MGFFRKLFGQDDETEYHTISPPSIKPSTSRAIAYDPKLVETLHAQHGQLGALFERIGRCAERGDYAKARTLLVRFKTSLQGHILTENVRFYAYLENALSDDAENARTIHDFRKEMNQIARQVVSFVDTWQDSDFATTTKRQQFVTHYEDVGKLLEQRLDNEENNLYPLYQPS